MTLFQLHLYSFIYLHDISLQDIFLCLIHIKTEFDSIKWGPHASRLNVSIKFEIQYLDLTVCISVYLNVLFPSENTFD